LGDNPCVTFASAKYVLEPLLTVNAKIWFAIEYAEGRELSKMALTKG
jgi:hypothetical protein